MRCYFSKQRIYFATKQLVKQVTHQNSQNDVPFHDFSQEMPIFRCGVPVFLEVAAVFDCFCFPDLHGKPLLLVGCMQVWGWYIAIKHTRWCPSLEWPRLVSATFITLCHGRYVESSCSMLFIYEPPNIAGVGTTLWFKFHSQTSVCWWVKAYGWRWSPSVSNTIPRWIHSFLNTLW